MYHKQAEFNKESIITSKSNIYHQLFYLFQKLQKKIQIILHEIVYIFASTD